MKGRLEDMAVADIIQHNCHSRNAARVELKSERQHAALYFKNGNVVHATMNKQQGEEVVYRVLAWEQGNFSVQMDVEPPEVSISKTWSSLLLEGVKRLDEGEQEETRPNKANEDGDRRNEPEVLYSPLYVPAPQAKDEADEAGGEAPGASAQEEIKEMAGQTEGFMLAALADISGQVLASTAGPDMNVTGTLQQASHYLRTVNKAVNRLGAGQMEDNLLTTKKAVLVARFLEDGETFLLLAAEKNAANLGNMRHLAEIYTKRLSKLELNQLAAKAGQ